MDFPNATSPLRALLYARVSSEVQQRRRASSKDEPSLGEQVAAMRGAAASHAWPTVGEVADVITGSVPVKERPGGQTLYQRAEAGEFDLLLLYDNDRVGRDEDAVVAKVFRAHMRQLGVQIFSVHQPVEPKPRSEYQPYEDDAALWLEAVSDTASSVYIRQLRRRVTFGMRNRVTEKKLMPGCPPIGYDAERHVLPSGKSVLGKRFVDERFASIVRRIFDEYEAGQSMHAVAGILNREGLRTPKGAPWSEPTIRGIINNPTYYGAAVYYKRRSTGGPQRTFTRHRKPRCQPMESWLIVEDAQHPAIITKEQWERCQAIKKKRRHFGRSYGESSLLSGLVRCGKCGGAMIRHSSWKGGYFGCGRYWWTGRTECEPNNFRRFQAEENVVAYIASLANDPDLARHFRLESTAAEAPDHSGEAEGLRLQIAVVDERLAKSREAFEAGIDTLEEFGARKTELTQQRKQLTDRLEELRRRHENTRLQTRVVRSLEQLLKEFPVRFARQPLGKQKLLLREIIERIEIEDGALTVILKDISSASEYEQLFNTIHAFSEFDSVADNASTQS